MMSDNMNRVREASSFIDAAMARIAEIAVTHRKGYDELDITKLDTGNISFILYELLSPYGFNQSTVDDIVHSHKAGATAKRFLGKNGEAVISGEKLFVRRKDSCSRINFMCGQPDGIGSVSFEIHVADKNELQSLKTAADTVLMDYDRIAFPLRIRRWRDGDDFAPFGMKGRKKVGDYMTDAKVNPFVRDSQTVVECAVDGKTEIVWLAGLRAGDKVKITQETKKVLVMKICRGGR